MHLYSNDSSTMATIFSLNLSELFPAFLSCSNNFYPSHNLSGSVGEIFFQNPEAKIAGELTNFIRDLSVVLGRPIFLISKIISSVNSRNMFRSCGLE